jgi:hypothetical protein
MCGDGQVYVGFILAGARVAENVWNPAKQSGAKCETLNELLDVFVAGKLKFATNDRVIQDRSKLFENSAAEKHFDEARVNEPERGACGTLGV